MSIKAFARPSVEHLGDRTLPSATVLDLTTHGAEVAANGFIARQIDHAPKEDFTKFVKLHGWGTEQGYNTTGDRQFNEVRGRNIHPELALSEVPTVVVGGVAYREFVLNINQWWCSPKLSLDKVQIFTADVSNLDHYDRCSDTLSGRSPVFDLDSGENVSILLNAQLNADSGFGDMALLVPDSAFAGVSPDSFVYLYSKLGQLCGARANGGAETWGVDHTQPPPNTGGSSLSGFVFVDAFGDYLENGIADPDVLLPDVTVTLYRQNDAGELEEVASTQTVNGFYEFTGLSAGIYTIVETQPTVFNMQALDDGVDYLGSLGGDDTVNDTFSGIVVGEDQH
ncbi:MAG: hypothetical protein L0241_25080, partial [Planctomycetia bacterium]|nr:hypothetical protein [Planctomycetia bacterium]